ncbi:MAG TPA: hypothetical protein VMB79_05430 [Jatrophihabitans sp.]|nr:hypothetical protein [Jatrophihabitans sp.]
MNANDLWFTARGAGLSALLTLSVATACGALGSMRSVRPETRVVIQYLHRTAALLGLGLILVHVSTIVLDTKSHVSLAGVLVPFASHYRPNAVALGSIAAYLLLAVAALGLARGKLATSPRGSRLWRTLHAVAYPVWTLAVLHSLLAGTDRHQAWVLALTFGCLILVLLCGAVRLMTLDDPAGSPAGTGTGRKPAPVR